MTAEGTSDITDPNGLDGGSADADSARVGQKRQREEPDSGIISDEAGPLILSDVRRPDKRRTRTSLSSTPDEGPAVHITYDRLTRESKAKLTELLKYWSQWHSQNQSTDPATESGTVIYFPPSSADTGSFFWVDKPRSHGNVSNPDPASCPKDFNLNYEQDCEVPQYDRSANAVLCSERDSGEGGNGVYLRIEKDAPRCWNCASYTHNARECPKPRNQEAFNAAREEFNAKRGIRPGEASQRRYFEGGAYDDLKPGVLTTPLREALGIQADDPPPWLQRMRELGYPPGYVANEDASESPSGIEIFGLDEGDNLGASAAAADVSKSPAADVSNSSEVSMFSAADVSQAPRKKLVSFPGINAPIPDGADPQKWEDRHAVQQDGWRRYGGWSEAGGGALRSADVTSFGANDTYETRGQEEFDGMHRGPHRAAAYGGNVSRVEGHVSRYEAHIGSYGGHAPGYDGLSRGYASHVTENEGYGHVAGHEGHFLGRSNGWVVNAHGPTARNKSTPPRKRTSRWDEKQPEVGCHSESWPGQSETARLGVRDEAGIGNGGGGSGRDAIGGSANGFGNGGEVDMDTEPDDFPPGYENAQQWQTGGAYAYQHGGASQEGTPPPPPSFYSPAPPPPLSYTPSPPPPPNFSPPPFPPGYSEPRELTPPLYAQHRQDSASPQPAFASPETFYTPESRIPVHAQPEQQQTWEGFWPQNHPR